MIPHFKGSIPFVDPGDMSRALEITKKDYNVSVNQIVESAGLQIALLGKIRFLENDAENKKITIVAGSGLNGGGALVAARHLANWGSRVRIVIAGPVSKIPKSSTTQIRILQNMGLSFAGKIQKSDLVIEAISDYNIEKVKSNKLLRFIEQINNSESNVLSIEKPAGIDLHSGKPSDLNVVSDATICIGIPKTGLFKIDSSKYSGELYLADAGIPPQVFKKYTKEYKILQKVYNRGVLVRINKMVVFNT